MVFDWLNLLKSIEQLSQMDVLRWFDMVLAWKIT